MDHADLVIFLGAGFNERTSYLWDDKLLANKKVVQIDNDAEQLEKVFSADVAIHGDIREAMSAVLEPGSGAAGRRRRTWANSTAMWPD